MEWLLAKAGVSAVQWTIGGIAGIGVAWALKKIPNATLKAKFGLLMYRLGIFCTLGMGRWKVTKAFWNKYIEPWVVDAISNIIGHGISEFIRGLRSDN